MSERSSYAITNEAKVTWTGNGVLVPKEPLPVSLRDLVVKNPEGALSIFESQWNDRTTMERVPLHALRFKYKKEIAEDVLKGYLGGTLYVGNDEVDWLWDVKCYVDGVKVDIHDALDYEELEDAVGKMLDGEISGTIEKAIEYQVTVDVIDTEENLVCGDVTVSSDFMFFGSFFSTDGSHVVYSEDIALQGESLDVINATIIEMLDE